jgi:tetratricopeptide (TPR) repeat protein
MNMKTCLCAFVLAAMVAALAGLGLCAEQKAPASSLERAKGLLLSNKPAEALTVLSSFSPSHEEMSAYHYAYARSLVGVKKYYESLGHYRLAYVYASETADQERLLIERADVFAAMGYYPEAAVAYSLFLRKYAKSGYTERAEQGAGDALFKSNEYRRALAHYEKAGTSGRAVMSRANALEAVGRSTEARALYRALIEHESRLVNASPETLYWIGENFRRTGNLKDARVYLELVKDPGLKPKAALGLGRIALEEKNYEAAIMQFAVASASRDRTVREDAVLYRAFAQMQAGKRDEARATLVNLRLKSPYGPAADQAALYLAQLLRKEGRFSESADMLKTLIYRRKPVPAAVDELESMILEAKDRDPKGFVKLWSEAGPWMLDPSRAATVAAVAKALSREGKPFLDVCAWLVKFGPEDAKSEGRLLLARFYADLGDAATAWSYFKRAKIKEQTDETKRLKTAIYLANNDLLNAAETIMTLAEPREKDLQLLVQLMPSLRQREKAVNFCERFLRRGASPAVMTRFADALYVSGNRKKALEYYRAALSTAPGAAKAAEETSADRSWAHYRIASIVGTRSGSDDLRAIQADRSSVGRFAAVELKTLQLPARIP